MKKEMWLFLLFIFLTSCVSQPLQTVSIQPESIQSNESEAVPVAREQASEVIETITAESHDYSPEKQEKILSVKEEHWKRVFDKAFEDVNCPTPRDPNSLPESYYKGPMIDTHIHIQSLPDGEPGHPDDYYSGDNIGIKRSINEWICMINVEKTNKVFGFFPVWNPIRSESIKIVRLITEKYPSRIIPFIMPPDNNEPTVVAEELEEMVNIEPELFVGYGEIGLYGNSNSPPLPPDSTKMLEIYTIAQKYNLIVYLHLGVGHKESLERAATANPNVTFIFHGDQLIDCAQCDGTPKAVAEILKRHPNVYYGIDELYGDVWLLQPGKSKTEFLAHFANYEPLLKKDIQNWKKFIETYPDQVLWGSDRGVSTPWDTDPEVALTINNYTRAFIGQLDPSVQKKFAFQNAQKLLNKK